MIPVKPAKEPDDFDDKVRKPGHEWLKNEEISFDAAPPDASKLPSCWRYSNKQLWEAYSGVCAYYAIFIEYASGASTTDHFIAKSRNAGKAYEWSNYRLSCLEANRKKSISDDVLDPFKLEPETFIINFASGKISPNQELEPDQKAAARKTIDRLKLDSPENNEMRARHFTKYRKGRYELEDLRNDSPFVHAEIVRQGLERD